MEKADFSISWPGHFQGDESAFLLAYKDIEFSSSQVSCDAAVRMQDTSGNVTPDEDPEQEFFNYVSLKFIDCGLPGTSLPPGDF